MRQMLHVDLIELIGSNYEIGVRQGEQIEVDKNFHLLQMTSKKVNSSELESILKGKFLGFLEEIRGIAVGLRIDFDTALSMYSGYDLSFPSMGCTAFSQNNYYVRNYDFTPELYDGRLVFYKSESGYASIGFSQQIVGRLDGMNEHGLVVGLHLVNEGYKGPGFIGTTIVRLVLDQCKNVEEAIQLISNLPHGYCYNYSLMDKDGNKCMIEASPERQVVNHHSILMCTNHFETEQLREKNRPFTQGSIHRKKILKEFASEDYSPEEAFQKFNEENSPWFYKEYRQFFGTLHTVVYIPETLEVIVGIGGNAAPTMFSLDKWLQGEQELKGKLIGEIDY